MKKTIGLLSLGLLFSACTQDPDPGAFGKKSHLLELAPGENRLMLRGYSFVRGKDTSWFHGLDKIEFEKDTLLNGSAGRIFATTRWDLFPDSIHEYHGRQLIVQAGDSLFEYHFKGGYVSPRVGLFKASAFDTAVFSGRVLHAVFPLKVGVKAKTLAEENPWGEGDLEKEYVFSGNCGTATRSFECARFVMRGSGIEIWTSVTRIGVLSADITYTDTAVVDSLDTRARPLRENNSLLKENATNADIEAFKLEFRSKAHIHPVPVE